MPEPIEESGSLTSNLIEAFKSEFEGFKTDLAEDKKNRVDEILNDFAVLVVPALASPNSLVRVQATRDAKILKTELLALAVITEIEAAERINAAISKGISVLTSALIASI